MNNQWFSVDKAGLAKVLRRRGMAFVLYELVQNSWDTETDAVEIKLEPIRGRSAVKLTINDSDPDGFRNLVHAYTLFAESERKGEAGKRGRFNLGEKLVLAVCETATIRSTTGTIIFDDRGRRRGRERLQQGTEFEAIIRMTRAEIDSVIEAAGRLICPVPTFLNGKLLPTRTPLHSFEISLPTEIADDASGVLRRPRRTTSVRVYSRLQSETFLYELGIPVVGQELPWDIEVMQKIPLNMDRDNVTPGYLQEVRVAVMNEMHDQLPGTDVANPAVSMALADRRIRPEAVDTILTMKFGEKRAIYDPSDLEANHKLVSRGYNLIHGGTFPKEAWESIRRADAARPAGQIAPTYKAYSDTGTPAQYYPLEKWTPGMRRIAEFTQRMARQLIGHEISVLFEKGRSRSPFSANYGDRVLTFNHDLLGKKWFQQDVSSESVLDLIIHELAHEYASNHLDEKFHKACTKLAAKAVQTALTSPEIFELHSKFTDPKELEAHCAISE